MPDGLGEAGLFRPAESAFMRPGTYEKSLEAEALKQARYLAHMDEVAASIEAAEERLEMQLDVRREELALRERLAGEQLEFQRETLAATKEYQKELIGIQKEKLDVADPFRAMHPAQRAEIYRRGREPAPAPEAKPEMTPAEELDFLRQVMPIIRGTEGEEGPTTPYVGRLPVGGIYSTPGGKTYA